MKILILQDHTEFFSRMLEASIDHHIGLPLSVPAIDAIRTARIVCRVRKELKTLGEVQEMLKQAAPGAESNLLERAIAAGVEGDVEGWYCVAEDEGFEWLTQNHAGPVLRWNGGAWWGRLKGIKINAEIITHESFKQRRRRSGARKDAAPAASRPMGPVSTGFRRPDVRPIG